MYTSQLEKQQLEAQNSKLAQENPTMQLRWSLSWIRNTIKNNMVVQNDQLEVLYEEFLKKRLKKKAKLPSAKQVVSF